MAGITRHVELKLKPARKHRLGHKASGRPKEPPTSTLKHNETFTLSNLNIFSVRPLITGRISTRHHGTMGQR